MTATAASDTKALSRPQSNDVAPPEPQYIDGFDGMSVAPFADEVRAVFSEAVDPDAVEIRPDGLVYLPGVWYRRQLTRAFKAGGWALAPRGPAKAIDDLVVYHGALYGLGRFVSEAVGECRYRAGNENMSYASALEGARTDCLTRCCKDLGMGTELWDPQWRAWWQALYSTKRWDDKARNGRGGYVFTRKGNAEVHREQKGKPVYDAASVQQKIAAADAAAGPGAAPAASRNSSTPVEKPAAKQAPKDEPISRAQTNELGTRVKKIGMSKDRSREWVQKVFAAEGWAKLSRKAADQAKVRLDAIIVVQAKLAELKIDADTAALWMEQHFAGDGEKLDWMTLDAERLAHAVTLLDEEAKS